MPNTTATVTVKWKPGQMTLLKGTPLDQYGNIANNADAYGIVTQDVKRPNTATVITAGEWDEVTNYCGYALTDDCKRALAAINFVGAEGERRPVTTLPAPKETDADKNAAVNENGNAYTVGDFPEFPAATTETAGAVLMAEAVPDSEEETSPTTAEFNALLAALRTAGIIAPNEE